MPALFETLSGIPARVTAGEQDSWTESFSDYPNSTYRVEYVFVSDTPMDGRQSQTVVGAETDTSTRTFTLPAAIKPGVYQWEQRIVRQSDSVSRVAQRGCMIVAPDLSVTPTVTYAQEQVAAIQTALGSLSTTTNISVSFNGQSFTKGDTSKLQGHLAYWESRVIRERRMMDQLTTAVAEYDCQCNCE